MTYAKIERMAKPERCSWTAVLRGHGGRACAHSLAFAMLSCISLLGILFTSASWGLPRLITVGDSSCPQCSWLFRFSTRFFMCDVAPLHPKIQKEAASEHEYKRSRAQSTSSNHSFLVLSDSCAPSWPLWGRGTLSTPVLVTFAIFSCFAKRNHAFSPRFSQKIPKGGRQRSEKGRVYTVRERKHTKKAGLPLRGR